MTKTLPLSVGNNYVFIDAIYIDNFEKVEHDLLLSTSLFDLRAVLFPYTGNSYAIFKASKLEFNAMIRGMEQTLLSASYTQDMQAIKQLMQARAPFTQILDLL